MNTDYRQSLHDKYDKTLLNKNEVANELGIHWGTVDRLRKRGDIKSVLIGGQVRFTIDEITNYLERVGA